ncbi:uncharacterized protein LY89DRAFT_691343 [Mollisia scopiformis]|uniref:Uncharacterized protein n=1 Tax=Mollisia scopiformis TaxID=149040 RepID=A0A132B6S5_MOLSC|nr:uncharacterized protein LY89DRAFT_691343 [Mollisia scopiformis]KUJ08041.1 hypothetical protein LY89DRAFT_691343 [Mollisia scopiformis]
MYSAIGQKEPKYDVLEDESAHGELKAPRNVYRGWVWHLIINCILGIAFATTLTLYLRLLHEINPPKLECGKSIHEAISRGCTFDYVTKLWLPAACPRTGIEGYTNLSGGWKYYTAKEGGAVIEDISVVLGANHMWWTTEREHLAHCAYLLMRVAEVAAKGGRRDMDVLDYEHTKHCTMLLLDRSLEPSPNLDEISVLAGGKFGSC